MKKTVVLFFFIISSLTFAQISTVPALPTANDEITITFDATGTGLDGYTGDVYAHTGVLTSQSNDDTDWKYVIAGWTENTDKAKLTIIATNTYQFIITPNLSTFYNITNGDLVSNLAFVFRSADGSKQTANLYQIIYENGLNITFTEPTNGSAFNLNSTIK